MKTLALAICCILLGGCALETARGPSVEKPAARKGEPSLKNGLRQYEDGDLKAAQKNLQEALALGLSSDTDKLAAHKYLAFIYCASGLEKPCRDEFHRAFEINASFKLERSEIGHPLWGPVYNSVRAELQAKGKLKP